MKYYEVMKSNLVLQIGSLTPCKVVEKQDRILNYEVLNHDKSYFSGV